MAEGNVRVDAEFATSHTFPRERTAPRAVGVTAVAIAVAAFALGWVFGAATPSEELASPSPASTTTMTWDVTPTTVVSASLPIAAPARLPSALGAAVPGFADSVTFVVENDRTVDIVRWLPTHPEPEILLSIDRAMLAEAAEDTDLPPVALDSSGRWYALIDSAGALAVGSIPAVDDTTAVVEAATVAGGSGELITTPTWNVAEPGRLAWLESSTAGDESVVALRTVDVGGDVASQIATIAGSLEADEWSGIEAWLSPGIVLRRSAGSNDAAGCALVDEDGTATTHMTGLKCIAEAPDGRTLWSPSDTDDADAGEPFLLSLDGLRCTSISCLEPGEVVCRAAWSPDGGNLAMSLKSAEEGPRLRIVDSITGEISFDARIPMESCCALAWSPDGRRVALAARTTGSGSQIFVAEPGNLSLGTGHSEARFGDPGCARAILWSSDSRFVVAPIWHQLSGTSTLAILDTERGFEASIPVAGRLVDTRVEARA